MKKLLLVTDAWHPQVNGVVSTFEAITRQLKGRGVEVTVIHPGLFSTMPLPLYPEIRLSLFPGTKIRRIIKETKPDYIHIATEGSLGMAARSIAKRKKIPFTTSYHTHFQLYIHIRLHRFLGFVYGILSWFHKAGRKTLVATSGLRSALEAHDFKHLEVWPLGVDTDLFIRNENPPLSKLPGPVFVFFSRLAPEKNPEAFLKLRLPGTKLVIGDGPDRARLEKKYGDTALFVGSKHGEELVNWLSLCDVMVFPSRTETFGLVMLEALACGVPVAAHNVMGPRDIITPGKDGYLSDNLEEAALRCLTLKREDCRQKALQYSWQHSADIFLSHLVPIK